MQTRLTIDLKDTHLLSLIKMEAARQHLAIRDVIVNALNAYFADREETTSLTKLAEVAFSEWDNPKDAAYDR